ncbi:hypothetical protein Peur_035623 [Populus x canadensis]
MARLSDDVTSVSIHEYGVSLDDRKSKVQCKFCDKVVSGFYRLKFHIGGVRGDVAPCDAAPLNVREQFRWQILEAKGKSLAQESDHPRNDQSAAAVNAWTGGLLVEREGESQTSVSNEVAEYFLETGINVKLSDPPRFQGIFGETISYELDFEVLEEKLKDVQEKIRKSHMHIFWAVSASDCMGLMLEKIAAVNDIRRVLDEATSLVRFVHNNAAVLKMFRDFTGSERENLFKPSKMRSAIPFLILESILSYKEELKEMFTSLEWKSCFWSQQVEGKKAAGLVKSSSFWKRAGMASKATTALIRVVDKISADNKPSIGFIYETMDQIKEAIQYEFRDSKSGHIPLWELIDEIWDDFLHSPLHAAAYYLNPTFFYNRNFHLDTEVSSGLQCSVIRMENDQRIQYLINKQAAQYCRADGDFENGYAEGEMNNAHPDLWWSVYGNRCPELQKLAIRILSQTCDGSGRYSLDRSLAEKLVCKEQNQHEQHRLRDQMFVRYNLQLEEANKKKRKAGGDIDSGGRLKVNDLRRLLAPERRQGADFCLPVCYSKKVFPFIAVQERAVQLLS